MLFRDELYTLEDVMRAAKKNPDILWLVYETNHEPHKGSCGAMSGATIVTKFG